MREIAQKPLRLESFILTNLECRARNGHLLCGKEAPCVFSKVFDVTKETDPRNITKCVL
jgi:hypothetical protein